MLLSGKGVPLSAAFAVNVPAGDVISGCLPLLSTVLRPFPTTSRVLGNGSSAGSGGIPSKDAREPVPPRDDVAVRGAMTPVAGMIKTKDATEVPPNGRHRARFTDDAIPQEPLSAD